jgi:transposase-like protein
LLEQEFRAPKQPVGPSWRMDETYVRVKGTWKYLYRAVDKAGATVDFLLTAKRHRKAALRFLRKAIRWNGTPEKIGWTNPLPRESCAPAAAPSEQQVCWSGAAEATGSSVGRVL